MGRREENKRIKRSRIESEALRLFLDQGFERSSVEQIVGAAEIARGTFYLYYADKETLFFSLADQLFGQLNALLRLVSQRVANAQTSSDCLAIYQEMAFGLGAIGVAQADLLMLCFRESRQPGPVGKGIRERELAMQELIIDFTQDAASRGLLNVPQPEVTVLVIYGAIERLYLEYMSDRDLGEMDVLAQEVLGLFWRAIGLPEGG